MSSVKASVVQSNDDLNPLPVYSEDMFSPSFHYKSLSAVSVVSYSSIHDKWGIESSVDMAS